MERAYVCRTLYDGPVKKHHSWNNVGTWKTCKTDFPDCQKHYSRHGFRKPFENHWENIVSCTLANGPVISDPL